MADISQSEQKTLRFDFNEAVAEARRDFPEQLKKITFIDLDAPDAAAQLQKFYDGLTPQEQKQMDNDRYASPGHLTADGHPCVWHTPGNTGLMLSYGSRQLLSAIEKMGRNGLDPVKIKHYTFWHELAHLVIKGGEHNSNFSEHVADSFSFMKGFQSGFLTKEDAKKIADGRDMTCWFNADVTHLTSMSIDALVINPKHIDFKALTPKDMAALARKHAETFSLHAELSAYYRLVGVMSEYGVLKELRQDRLDGLADIVNTADKQSMAFYVSARMLLTLKAKKEAGEPTLQEYNMSGEKFDAAFAAIAKKGKGRDIGAAKALTAEDKPQNGLQKLYNKVKPLSI